MQKRVSTNIQSYTAHIKTTQQPKTLLSKIINNNDSLEATLSLIYLLAANHPVIHPEILMFLDKMKIPKDDNEYACEQWVVKIVFIILECKQYDTGFTVLRTINIDYINFVLDLLHKESCIQTVKNLIIDLGLDFKDHLLREIKKNENTTFMRNSISVVIDLYADVDLMDVAFLVESEHFFLRNAFLEILFLKIQGKAKIEFDAFEVFYERLNDLNFYVRSKSLHILGLLYNEGLVEERINEVMQRVLVKIHDKTMIVRKRAICFFSNYLIKADHAVADEAINNIFGEALDKVSLLMKSGTSSEYIEILHLLKLCYYYEVNKAKEYFEMSFELIWDQKSKFHLLGCIREIIERMDPVDFFYKFSKENENYRKILQSIKFKKNWVEKIKVNLLKGVSVYESSFVLSNVVNIDIDYNLLFLVTKILFSSSNKGELETNCEVYKNILMMILRNIGKGCRCNKPDCQDCEVKQKAMTQIWKNVAKMNFCSFDIIDISIKILMRNKEFETNLIKMVEVLQTKKSHVILVYSLGRMALEITHFLDKAENKIKQLNIKLNDSPLGNIKEKRLSISRLSLRRNPNQVNNTFIENTIIDNTFIDNTMIFDNLQKRDEKDDVSDFIFLLKENRLFFSPDSIFREFLPLIKQMMDDQNSFLQNLGFITIFRYMSCSSEFFLENIEFLEKGLSSNDDRIQNTSLIALSEFIITYSAWVESYIPILFQTLEHKNLILKKNTLLIIYYMVTNNLIKLKGYGKNITKLLFDEDLSVIVKKLISELSENDIIGITYETAIAFDFENKKEAMKELMRHIEKEKTKEVLIERIKLKNGDEEILEDIKMTMTVKNEDESTRADVCV